MGYEKLQILLVDDDDVDALLTHRALGEIAGTQHEVERATSLIEADEKAANASYDIVLLDLGLPESVGIETLNKFREGCHDLPVIVLTGLADENTTCLALKNGAQDYLVKDEINSDSLSRSIRHSLQRHQLLQELESSNDLLKQKNERLARLYETAQQFVDNVSHEFRTPLTVIREFTSIIRDGLDGPVSDKQAEHLDKVLHRTDDLATMVDDMLDISKLEVGLLSVWRRPCRIEQLFEEVTSSLALRADSKSIVLKTEIPSDLPVVFCDHEKASRVIINLVVNAIKFTPTGGEVKLWAKLGVDPSEIVIGITDNGPGISPENLEAIFERFEQLNTDIRSSTKGFGLGLNIAKELVRLNLGTMSVESKLGEGSTFVFSVPCHNAKSLFEKYINQPLLVVNPKTCISLLAIKTCQIQEEAISVVDEFLQRVVRGNDLVLQVDWQSWAILAACPGLEVQDLIDRIECEWSEFVRNSPGVEFPTLNLLCKGSWNLHDERNCLVRTFEEIFKISDSTKHNLVIVVDDNPDVSHCLGLRLETAGFQVVSATDGEAGLEAIRQYLPDAVVLDVNMPKKSGLEVLKEMRCNESTKDMPVVMLSASIRDQHMALENGANFFVPKPYRASSVLSAIESSMNQEKK